MLDHNIECVLLLQNVFSYYRRRKGPRHFRRAFMLHHNMSEFMVYRGHVLWDKKKYEWIYGIQRTCPHLCSITICVNLWSTQDMSAFMLYHNVCEFMVYRGHVPWHNITIWVNLWYIFYSFLFFVSQCEWIYGIQRTCPRRQTWDLAHTQKIIADTYKKKTPNPRSRPPGVFLLAHISVGAYRNKK